jgi:DNA-binding XRE family transcriptional regulator
MTEGVRSMTVMAKKSGNKWPGRLKTLRAKYDLTQREAAERIGVALRTWISWENDQRIPSRLAERLLHNSFPDDFKRPK